MQNYNLKNPILRGNLGDQMEVKASSFINAGEKIGKKLNSVFKKENPPPKFDFTIQGEDNQYHNFQLRNKKGKSGSYQSQIISKGSPGKDRVEKFEQKLKKNHKKYQKYLNGELAKATIEGGKKKYKGKKKKMKGGADASTQTDSSKKKEYVYDLMEVPLYKYSPPIFPYVFHLDSYEYTPYNFISNRLPGAMTDEEVAKALGKDFDYKQKSMDKKFSKIRSLAKQFPYDDLFYMLYDPYLYDYSSTLTFPLIRSDLNPFIDILL